MTTTEPTIETPWDGEGSPPIFEADRLLARIMALDPERTESLATSWNANDIGLFPPGLVTAERYRQVERLVSNHEPSAPADFAHVLLMLHEDYTTLPDHIRTAAAEALSVYAGMEDPTRWVLTSTGRLEEVRRIVDEAKAYHVTQVADGAAIPSVADLPPADDNAEQLDSDVYPGNKADAKTVLAWVDRPDDATAKLNRAATAYAMEQERANPRKGVSAKLVEALGPDGLAKVHEALAAAQPPPLDLGGGSPTPTAEADGAVAPAPPVVGEEPSDVSSATAVVEAEATAPSPSPPNVGPMVDGLPSTVGAEPIPEHVINHLEGTTATPVAIANALDLIAAGFNALADAVREVA